VVEGVSNEDRALVLVASRFCVAERRGVVPILMDWWSGADSADGAVPTSLCRSVRAE
jgi:hypothetical protein